MTSFIKISTNTLKNYKFKSAVENIHNTFNNLQRAAKVNQQTYGIYFSTTDLSIFKYNYSEEDWTNQNTPINTSGTNITFIDEDSSIDTIFKNSPYIDLKITPINIIFFPNESSSTYQLKLSKNSDNKNPLYIYFNESNQTHTLQNYLHR